MSFPSAVVVYHWAMRRSFFLMLLGAVAAKAQNTPMPSLMPACGPNQHWVTDPPNNGVTVVRCEDNKPKSGHCPILAVTISQAGSGSVCRV